MAVTKYEVYDQEKVERAKNTVLAIARETALSDVEGLFNTKSLEEVETGIKALNSFSSKCWILSAIILYTIIYDKEMYKQSGLAWSDYSKAARQRLGLDPRDITEQLAGARFFIKYHDALLEHGWNTAVPNQSLARGEFALTLSGDLDETLDHMMHDTQRGFRDWYQSFKMLPVTPLKDLHPEIEIGKSVMSINGIEAVRISSELPPEQRVQIENYIVDLFQCLKSGEIPAIIPVADETEARNMIALRDKARQEGDR